jgi:hypothetical protein
VTHACAARSPSFGTHTSILAVSGYSIYASRHRSRLNHRCSRQPKSHRHRNSLARRNMVAHSQDHPHSRRRSNNNNCSREYQCHWDLFRRDSRSARDSLEARSVVPLRTRSVQAVQVGLLPMGPARSRGLKRGTDPSRFRTMEPHTMVQSPRRYNSRRRCLDVSSRGNVSHDTCPGAGEGEQTNVPHEDMHTGIRDSTRTRTRTLSLCPSQARCLVLDTRKRLSGLRHSHYHLGDLGMRRRRPSRDIWMTAVPHLTEHPGCCSAYALRGMRRDLRDCVSPCLGRHCPSWLFRGGLTATATV